MKNFYSPIFFAGLFLFLLLFSAGSFVVAQENNILITEVQISGDESKFDYIKIYNTLNSEIDLGGYKLRKRASTGSESSLRVFPVGTKVGAQGYLIWSNSDYSGVIGSTIESSSTLAKNNSIAVLDNEGLLLDAVAWGESESPFVEAQPFSENPGKNQQLARKYENGAYIDSNNNLQDFYIKGAIEQDEGVQDSEIDVVVEIISEEETEANNEISTGIENNFFSSDFSINQLPFVDAGKDIIILVGEKIEFDGSNSYDPENDILSFFWNFGNGETSEDIKPEYIYEFPGNYQVALEVSDGKESSIDFLKVSVLPKGIIISEIFPNPRGSDKGAEWIEIYNGNEQIVDISGFEIISKTKKFVFPENTFIFEKQFLVIKPSFSLTNKQGEIEFNYPNGVRIQKINYSETKEGQSLAFSNDGFYFSINPTPGYRNIIGVISKESIDFNSDERTYDLKEKDSNVSLQSFNVENINPNDKISTELITELIQYLNNENNKENEQNTEKPLNLSENSIKSGIKAQVGNINRQDLLILVFPTIVGFFALIYFFFIKRKQ